MGRLMLHKWQSTHTPRIHNSTMCRRFPPAGVEFPENQGQSLEPKGDQTTPEVFQPSKRDLCVLACTSALSVVEFRSSPWTRKMGFSSVDHEINRGYSADSSLASAADCPFNLRARS